MLENSGVQVQHCQSEGGQSQFEISLSPSPLMQAADAIISAREIIRTVLAQNLIATLHPCRTTAYSGTHIHLPIAGHSGKSIEESLLAGLPEHMGALCALGIPLPISYKRVSASTCSTSRFIA